MNFFRQQDIARRKTFLLVILFIPAVIGAVAVGDIAFTFLWALIVAWPGEVSGYGIWWYFNLHKTLLWGAGITLTAIVWQTLRTMRDLRDGSDIADAFCARWVDPNSQDPKERQLINVVEEMAIAAGMRVPSVYLLDGEHGLNACAAGYGMSDAIIVVTRGLLDNLSRDELQGVIGHEFSHILNGDMALNMRMIGLLAGIGSFGSIGKLLMGFSFLTAVFLFAVLLGGAVMAVVGYSGRFFARLIKAAVSREREYLADAASVQFTRNPDCIVSALEKMRTARAGTLIQNRYAEEASHMFIGESIRPWLFGLVATHPPLEKRIKRIMPDFSPLLFKTRERIAARAAQAKAPSQAKAQSQATSQPGVNIPAVPGSTMIAGLASAEAGRGSDAKVQVKAWAGQMAMAYLAGGASSANAARRLINSISPYLYQKTRMPNGACAVVLALMLAPKDEVRSAQLDAVKAAGMASLAGEAAALEPTTRRVAEAMRFPLIDLALPVIKHAALGLREGFLKALEAAIGADRRMSPHEFVVLTFVRFQTGGIPASHAMKYKSLDEVREHAVWLLSLVAYAGCRTTSAAERQKEFETAFAAGIHEMKLENAVPASSNSFNQQTAMTTLSELRKLAPLAKSRLIDGLLASVMADNEILVIEAELMRMVGAVLDCPLPPLIELPDSMAAS